SSCLGRGSDLVVDILARQLRTELRPVMAAGIDEVVLLPDFGPPVDDVESQEPQHLGFLKIELGALRSPELGLNDELSRRHTLAPTGLARPGEPACRHLRGGLEPVLISIQKRRNEKAG